MRCFFLYIYIFFYLPADFYRFWPSHQRPKSHHTRLSKAVKLGHRTETRVTTTRLCDCDMCSSGRGRGRSQPFTFVFWPARFRTLSESRRACEFRLTARWGVSRANREVSDSGTILERNR